MRHANFIVGYTIPKGWALMVVPAALQLNPNTYEDPLAFNPWRWQVCVFFLLINRHDHL